MESNTNDNRRLSAAEPVRAPFAPVRVAMVDVASPIPGLTSETPESDAPYTRAVTYVRWQHTPIGLAWSEIPPGGLSPEGHATSIWEQLGSELSAHGTARGIDVAGLGTEGLGTADPGARDSTELPHITVVVATRDRPELLDRCLQSILGVDYPNFDVLVVDNAPSSEASAELIASRYGRQRLRRVREDRPGLAAAHNRGIEEARGEILAFTDDDVLVDAQWLRAIAAGFASAPNVGCVTGMIVPLRLDTRAQWWLEGYAGYAKGFVRRTYNLAGDRPDDFLFPYAAGKLGSGANMAFRADVLSDIGGFDDALGAGSGAYGGDDLAAFFDVVSQGHTLVYEPGAIVHHEHPATEEQLARQVFGYGAGLTAYLTSALLDRPSRFFTLAARAPHAMWYALGRTSDRNARQPHDFPPSLRWRELAGMAVGPAAYVRTRLRRRRADVRKLEPGAGDRS